MSTSASPGRLLLAEANQWPDDVVAYFGNGDECHILLPHSIMPRGFMALQQRDWQGVTEISIEHTPEIPASAQWGMFLRNHDELTLEMVTDGERDYLYSEFARAPRVGLRHGYPPPSCAAAREQQARHRAFEFAAS